MPTDINRKTTNVIFDPEISGEIISKAIDDAATTLRVYTHYCESNGEKAAAAVGALMDSLPKTNVIKLEKPTGRWGISAVAI